MRRMDGVAPVASVSMVDVILVIKGFHHFDTEEGLE